MLDFDAVAEDDPVDVALAKIFRADITEADDLSRRVLLQLVGAERGLAPELATAIRTRGYEPSRAQLAEWIENRRTRGELTFDDSAALDYAGILLAMVFAAPDMPSEPIAASFNASRYRAHIRRCIAVFLGGVGSSGRRQA
jgi:hypothetical protein